MRASEDFSAFIRGHGYEPPANIEAGRFVRFSTNGKRNDDAGYAKLFPDGEGGIVGDFRSGQFDVWRAATKTPATAADRQAWKERIEKARSEAEAERERTYAEARDRAQAILSAATGDPATHPYVLAKKGLNFGSRIKRGLWPQRGWTDALLLPILQRDGAPWSIEAINTDGTKDFLKGGKVGAGLYPFGKITGASQVLIGEGVATVAAVVSAMPGCAGAAALSSGNLDSVVRLVRDIAAPDADLVILADNDPKPDGSNPGLAQAIKAARAYGARLAVPDTGERSSDFWDIWSESGPEAIKSAIRDAKPVARHTPQGNPPTAPASDSMGMRPVIALEIGELLQRDFPMMEALLSPWLRKQHLSMIHAKRGVGKTHFALGIAYAVAGGGTFLKWKAEKPHKVLYIDGEMPGAAIKERLAAIVKSSPEGAEPPEGYFRIITPDVQDANLPDLGTAEGQAEFAPLLADADLIVIDNLSTLLRSGAENEGESWLPMARWALERRREGRAVLFVHHAGKSGAQRGSSRREDLLDVVINLAHSADYSPESGAQFRVKFEKSRGLYGEDVREIEASLTQSGDGGHVWTWREAEGATRDRVIELARLDMKGSEIAAELGVNKSTVSRHLRNARESGLLPKVASVTT